MRFVATKTQEQQSCLTLHRTRHLFIRQQTSVINAIRAHLAEFGIVAPVGRNGVEQLLGIAADASDKRLPEIARACVAALGAQLRMLKAQILQFDRMIMAGQDPVKQAGGSTTYPASVQHWRPLWSPASPIRRCFDPVGTSRPGSGLCRSRTRAEARTGSAISANEAIAICAACSRPERSRSSVMPKSMAPSTGLGSLHCWRGDRRRSRPSRLPTRSHGWRGRSWLGANATRNRPRSRLERDRAGCLA